MTGKFRVSKFPHQRPDDCTNKDMQYPPDVLEAIRKRLDMANRGDTVSHAQMKKRVAKWLV